MKHFLAALALALPCVAMAQPYLAGQVGFSHLLETDATAPNNREFHISFEAGYSFAIRSGYDFGQLRIEGELRHSSHDLDTVEIQRNDTTTLSTSGNIASTSFLINGIYAFRPHKPIQPYVGAGIGVSYIRLDDTEFVVQTPRAQVITRVEGFGVVLAYQFMLGIDFHITKNTALYAEYRYFVAATPQFKNAQGTNINLDYMADNVAVGLRYTF